MHYARVSICISKAALLEIVSSQFINGKNKAERIKS